MAQSKPWPRAVDLPPLLIHVARAIAHQASVDATPAHEDHLAALTELAQLAMLSVPARGVTASEDLRIEIDRVADRHLRRRSAQKEFVLALDQVKSCEKRDAIDSAHIRIVDIGELAYYYAGIAVGLTLAELGRK